MTPKKGTTSRVSEVSEGRAENKRGLAMFYMVISSIVISFGGLILRSIETANPFQVNFYRSIGLLGAVLCFLVMRYRSETARVVVGIGKVGILGGMLLAGAGICFLQALAHTTVANTLFVLGAIPFFAALFARVLLGERINAITLATMAVAAAGLLVMVREGVSIGNGYGNGMALMTAVLFALYAVIVRGKRRTDMMPTLLVSSVIIMLVAVLVQVGDLGIDWRDILLCLVWGAVLSGVANFLFIAASRHLAAAEVTLFMLLEFALGPVWVWMFVNEIPGHWTLVGGAMIISAVAMKALLEILRKPGKSRLMSGPV